MGAGVDVGEGSAWAEETSADLNAEGARRCSVSLLPDEDDPVDIRVDGCPACGHDTTYVEPLRLVRGADRPARQPVRSGARDVVVYCQCAHAHRGAPEDAVGCGRWWTLHVEW
jgi:hypothetical protein